jgi:hypothetical protein
VVSSLSSRNRLPALGPRCTTSSAVSAGSASSMAGSASGSSFSSASSASARASEIVEVVSPGRSADPRIREVPQFEQKRASSGFGRPHCVQ